MKLLKGVKLAPFTTLRVGGKARYLAEPSTEEELKELLRFARLEGLPVLVLGAGSNVVLGDFDGLVIRTVRLRGLRVREEGDELKVSALCGTPLSELIKTVLSWGGEGIYRLAGFPATVGGAVAMNAGSFGAEVSDFLTSVKVITPDGEPERLKREELAFGYRSSPFPKRGLVLEAVFRFKKARGPLREKLREVLKKRKARQPAGLPTSGSAFKNPPGGYAGKLLESCGFKGFRVGGAGFSEKHANFLVNYGGASFEEVRELLELASERVKELTGTELEKEVKLVEARGAYGWKLVGA